MSERECLAAHTPCGDNQGYPPYVNFTLVGDHVEFTVRSPRKPDGTCGDCSLASLPRAKALEILEEAVAKLRTFT